MEPHAQSIRALARDLKNRFEYPQHSYTFYTQLIVTVIGCGGAGIWWTIHTDGFEAKSLAAALLTYFPPLVAASTIDFIQEKKQYLRMFGFSAGVTLGLIFLLAVTRDLAWQFWWAIIGTLLSIIFWWLANGEKDWVKDNASDTPTGGDVNKPLLAGNDAGWKK